jgi:ribosome-associated protein
MIPVARSNPAPGVAFCCANDDPEMNITEPNQPNPQDPTEPPDDDDLPESSYALRPNKEEGKRETSALKELALRLAKLPPEQLKQFDLSERTVDAIDEFNRIKEKARSGRKRQVQLMVKLLREEDAQAIAATFEDDKNEQRAQSLHLQRVANLRDELIRDNDQLEAFLTERGLDNEFRSLVRQARREQAKNGKPHAQRALYRQLQSMLDTEENDKSQ